MASDSTNAEKIKETLKGYSIKGSNYSGRYLKMEEDSYKKDGPLFKGGFYYDCQLEDPHLSMSLHANTRIDPNSGEWKFWDEVEGGKCLDPISEGIPASAKYGIEPIARCILSEDFSYSISNNWSDYNGGNPIEGIFENMKPYAPILGKVSQNLKEATENQKKQNTGSGVVDVINNVASRIADFMGNASSYLQKALYVQGTRFTYYNGTQFNFNNMEMKFIAFSDYVYKNGKWEFQSVEDYIKTLQPYVMGIYNPYNADFLEKLGDIGDKAREFIAEYVGFQEPPGGFEMDTKNLDNTLKGTLRLNIGGTWAIDNLVLKNMNVVMSRIQAKHPEKPGETIPLYAEISLQLSPASALVDSKYNKILDHKGMKTIRESVFKNYSDKLDELKTEITKKLTK